MNALIVGAGAVGQVYGRHLALGGAHVRWFVRDRHADECRRGFLFYPLNRARPREQPVRLEVKAEDVLTRAEELRAMKWDQVYLCVGSHSLEGAWLGELLRAVGDATVVSLAPGFEDRARVAAVVPDERLVCGMITLISYGAPLPGEKVPEPGMAYWFPPLTPAPFSGPAERTRAVVEALSRGGLPAKVAPNVSERVLFPSIVLMTLLTALEAAGWSFRALARGDALARVRAAMLEAFAITGAAYHARPPSLLRFVARPFFLRRILTLARWMLPLDVETYFRVHFTKVRAQTRLHMRSYIEHGQKLGRPTQALTALEGTVAQAA